MNNLEDVPAESSETDSLCETAETLVMNGDYVHPAHETRLCEISVGRFGDRTKAQEFVDLIKEIASFARQNILSQAQNPEEQRRAKNLSLSELYGLEQAEGDGD